jgi:uncharacterized membrane protein
MSRYVARWVYILVAVVVCPLLAWHLAVDATNHGFGSRGFFIMLLGLPVIGALLAANLLRRRRREATFGAVGAVAATLALFVVLVFVTLSSR